MSKKSKKVSSRRAERLESIGLVSLGIASVLIAPVVWVGLGLFQGKVTISKWRAKRHVRREAVGK